MKRPAERRTGVGGAVALVPMVVEQTPRGELRSDVSNDAAPGGSGAAVEGVKSDETPRIEVSHAVSSAEHLPQMEGHVKSSPVEDG